MREMKNMEEVYRAHAQTVYRYLLSRTGDPDVSEELTQETFYQAVKSANKFNGSCAVVTWLCAIAKNKLREFERKKNCELQINDVSSARSEKDLACASAAGACKTDAQTVTSAEAEIISSENRVELMKTLQQLEGAAREVIYMRLFGELSFREIGEVLGRSENWARVTYYRGKERLKKTISEEAKGGTGQNGIQRQE